jgi:hypothetical protein
MVPWILKKNQQVFKAIVVLIMAECEFVICLEVRA